MRTSSLTRARTARRSAVAAIVTVTAAALATVAAPPASATPAPTTQMQTQAPTQRVTYHGYRLDVPSGWPVVDLSQRPGTCVRFDVRAVYLGHPGSGARCPAHAAGRTEAILLEPLDRTSAPRIGDHTAIPRPGKAVPDQAPVSRDAEIQVAVQDAGVLVTVTHGADQRPIREILGSAGFAPGGIPADAEALRAQAASTGKAAPTAKATGAAASAVTPGGYTGLGFDACTAPSSAAMEAWLNYSSYQAVGVYIGGASRACAQPNLTAAWVGEQTREGWHLLPIHVGLQAPCTSFSQRLSYDPATARSQGRTAADDAVAKAQALGIQGGSALYNDMEGYDNTNANCSRAVLSFLSGWTGRLHERGYRSGVYSSASSGIRDLAAHYDDSTYLRPDHIWFAWWNSAADTDAGSYVPDGYWAAHQRVHQFRGDHNETHGGVTINIDGNYLDVDGGSARLDFPSYATLRTGSTGSQVKAAQELLSKRGYDAGAADGAFGAQTESAVRAFQSSRGLTADGVVGARTWTALLSAGKRPVLRQDDSGNAVARLQRALTAALGRTVAADGLFGSGTASAVRDYQSSRGLGADGIAGDLTWSALQAGK